MGEGNWVELEADQLEKLVGPFEYQAVSYDDVADYQAGLAIETAAGWDVVSTTNRAPAVGEEVLVVTYRRVPA